MSLSPTELFNMFNFKLYLSENIPHVLYKKMKWNSQYTEMKSLGRTCWAEII